MSASPGRRGTRRAAVAATLLATVSSLLGGVLPAVGAELRVLSAGAVEPGLVPVAQAFERGTGHTVRLTFATAPAIRQKLAAGEAADVLIAPPAVLDEPANATRIAAEGRRNVGGVGVGVVARSDAPAPDVGSVDALKASLLAAEGIVYNRASTGLYFEQLLARLGLAEALQGRTTRYPDGAGVLEHLAHGKGREFGVAATTEILAYAAKGVKLVGPLPAEVQNTTTYAAVTMNNAGPASVAQEFIDYLGSPEARQRLAAAGVN